MSDQDERLNKLSDKIWKTIFDEIIIWSEYEYFNETAKAALENPHNVSCFREVIKDVLKGNFILQENTNVGKSS
jgi:hypothetical protein